MKIDALLFAESLAQDARGAWSAIAVDQNVFASSELPATTKRALLVHITDIAPTIEIEVRIQVLSPSGKTLVAQTNTAKVEARNPFKGVPPALAVPAEFTITVNEYGPHEFQVELTDTAERVSSRAGTTLYVLDSNEIVAELESLKRS